MERGVLTCTWRGEAWHRLPFFFFFFLLLLNFYFNSQKEGASRTDLNLKKEQKSTREQEEEEKRCSQRETEVDVVVIQRAKRDTHIHTPSLWRRAHTRRQLRGRECEVDWNLWSSSCRWEDKGGFLGFSAPGLLSFLLLLLLFFFHTVHTACVGSTTH